MQDDPGDQNSVSTPTFIIHYYHHPYFSDEKLRPRVDE